MAIRFDKKLNREIRKVVDAYNKRLKRAEAKGIKYLPSHQSIKEIKQLYSTQSASRKELRYKLNELKQFNLKSASTTVELESGEKTSQFILNQIKRRKARLLRLNRKQIQEQEKIVKPEIIFSRSKLSKLKNIREMLQKPITKSRDSFRTINRYFYSEYSTRKLDTFYNNYFSIMDKQVDFIEYDKEKYKIIKEKMKKIPPDTMMKIINNNPTFNSILERYKKDEGYNKYDTYILEQLYDTLYENIDDIINEYTFEDYEVL